MLEIRPMVADDLPQIKTLIRTAWADSEEDNQAVVDAETFIYLNPAMHDSTFGRVAVEGTKVVGVVFCTHQDETPAFRRLQSDGAQETLSLLRAGQHDLQWVLNDLRQWEAVYAELTAGRDGRYQARIELLCVDPQWQRRYIATALLGEVMAYCLKHSTAYLAVLAQTPAEVAFFKEVGFTACDRSRVATDTLSLPTVYLCEKAVLPIMHGE
ncbi:GNAT family N-acetyltransferase [Levilactobacillus parabrevis]|uniref:GNAT family N-acetyltransferase n=1 Tax=Levilactobacillus parabrevis TaxID=357278 RepID=UPI003757A724